MIREWVRRWLGIEGLEHDMNGVKRELRTHNRVHEELIYGRSVTPDRQPRMGCNRVGGSDVGFLRRSGADNDNKAISERRL